MKQQVARVLVPVLVARYVAADELTFIHSNGLAAMRCNAHDGELGLENPKASITCGGKVFLLCKACWSSQGLREEDGSL